jgi:nucleoside-diphosphate-sugar epimerase
MAEELLGYSVETDFEEGLKRTVEWYRQAGAP